ncbi:MAG: DUF1343 domain-containing protein, partial [Planctomycetes bacterium]|nr:DUF1343 domain-containing protein [Planctomycetota bacterium]
MPKKIHSSRRQQAKPFRQSSPPVQIGLETCLDAPPEILRGQRFGLLMNQASIDHRFRYAHHLLAERFPGQLKALFSPQHGLWGEQQDNMIESAHRTDQRLGVPVYSLYSKTRRPTPEMLDGLDCLVVDLQDVGTRVYTFIWTVSYCLEACAATGIPVVVLDRPNPIGGELVEGPCLDPAFASFVGRAPIPMRHALTMGEMAAYLNDHFKLGAELYVVRMNGWRRAMTFSETGLPWVLPSPNLPRIEGVDVYPGQVLLEGTNLSEGRGTTVPFEVCGAPYIDPEQLIEALGAFDLPGLSLRPIRFEPTFQKWKGQSCGGLYLHVTDRQTFRPYRATLAMLACVRRLWPNDFAWRSPP